MFSLLNLDRDSFLVLIQGTLWRIKEGWRPLLREALGFERGEGLVRSLLVQCLSLGVSLAF